MGFPLSPRPMNPMVSGMCGRIVTRRGRMFERYTERARRVLFFARYEASQLGSIAIQSEHLLLGLLRDGQGVTSRVFEEAGLDSVAVHFEVGHNAADRP